MIDNKSYIVRDNGFPDLAKCDSPIEDIFYYDFQKVAALGAKISRQVECPTSTNTYYLDFLVQVNDQKIGFECDGKDFHDAKHDSLRDRSIIDAGHANRIYRLRGRDICYRLHDAFDLIRTKDRFLFSERGYHNIAALATRQVEHNDEFGFPKLGFPFAAIRWFKKPIDQDDYEYEQRFMQPTIVSWTDTNSNFPNPNLINTNSRDFNWTVSLLLKDD